MALLHQIIAGSFAPAATTSFSGKIVAVGDSLTAGVGGTSYPTQLGAIYPSATIVNEGVSGWTVANLVSNQATTDANRDPNYVCYLTCWIGTNDIGLYSASPASVFSSLQSYCLARRAAGYRVIVCDMITRSPSGMSNINFEADRATFNGLLSAGWTSFADGFVQLSTITQLTNYSNTTYFDADATHLTTAGYALVANAVNAAFTSVNNQTFYLLDDAGNTLTDDASNNLIYI